MHKIAVLDYRLLPDAKEQLQQLASNTIAFHSDRCPESERIQRTGDADIVLVSPWEKIDKTYLDACPNLKYVGLSGTSTANIDLEELKKRGIGFSNIVSKDKESVAEYIFMELVSLMRGAGEYQWKKGEEHELVGRRVGIIGMGEVGKAIAHLALAYKTQVSYFSPHRKQEWEDRGVAYQEMDQLVKNSEVLVVCSPTNVEVLHEADFNNMQPGTILVQASAGTPFSNENFKKWIAQEGNFGLFDMSASERNYQAYKGLPRVIFPRAVAGDTYESNQRRGQRAVANLKEFLKNA
jgi:phosphoglycerate dehydrogenase-like enzyme